MNLDHISYVTSHDQIADTIQRIGSRAGITFADGGIHPRFGTRNFTAPLAENRYLEVVCPLDHPATETTPWGKAVAKKAENGGGWFTWVFNVPDIHPFESKFGRPATDGHRVKPNGVDLRWKQIGIREIDEFPQLPFFIQWLTPEHPSDTDTSGVGISKIRIADSEKLERSWFKTEIEKALMQVGIEWIDPNQNDNQNGIVSIQLHTPNGVVEID